MADENDKEIFTSFLGTGWGFPPTFVRGINSVRTVSNEDDIRESIGILLRTYIGERIMQPEYGCNLQDLVFEPLDASLKTFFKEIITRAIRRYEPRVDLKKVSFETNVDEGQILVILDYLIIATNTRFNIVYPFYLTEGTNIV